MRAVTLSRSILVLLTVALSGACSDDPVGPPDGPDERPIGSSGTMLLAPKAATIEVGQSVALAARVVGQSGELVNLAISWRSSNNSVATVDASGHVTGRMQGQATIVARAGTFSQTARIIVRKGGKGPTIEEGRLLMRAKRGR